VLYEKWIEEYGLTYKYSGIMGVSRDVIYHLRGSNMLTSIQLSGVFTADTKAVNYVLMNSFDYQKPGPAKYNFSRILGNGVRIQLFLCTGNLFRMRS
jgi:hypothetical protein